MFNILLSPNKQVNAVVFFVDKDFKFKNQNNFFTKSELDQLFLFKDGMFDKEVLAIDMISAKTKKKIIIYKIKENSTEHDFQKAGGIVFNLIKNFKNVTIHLESEIQISEKKFLFSTNFLLGLYSKSYFFKNYKSKKKNEDFFLKNVSFLSTDKSKIKSAITYANSIFSGIKKTRNLVTYPANILTPKKFVDEILKLKKIGISVEILNEKKMKSLGMNALLGVGQGSSKSSYVAIMKWNGNKNSKKSPLAFVGKGVCFDTGGISLKPASHMEDMKYDMGGAGTVTGLMTTLALRKAKVNVVGLVGLVENMVDGNSQRPGDVVISYSGQSIEVLNTDAEGRLVLADVISYTEERFRPSFIINLATLTGAIIVSLGNEYAGLFSNNDELAKQIQNVGIKDNEKAWRLPLHENYDRLMDSKIADLQNINYSGGAGSITAAQFLQRFIKYKTPWAHLDIAGMAWAKKDSEVVPEGATGYGVKLLNRLVKEHYEK